MRGHTLALFTAFSLCLHHIHAAKIGVVPRNATAQQYGDSYEAQSGPKEPQGGAGAYSGSQQPYELCPDPQPADSFKQGDSTASVGTSCAVVFLCTCIDIPWAATLLISMQDHTQSALHILSKLAAR